MNKKSYIIIVLTFIFLSGLVFWQIRNLNLSEQLKTENDRQDIQSVLLATAIEIRKKESKDPVLMTNSVRKRNLTEELIIHNFEKFKRKVSWGYFNDLGQPIDSLNLKIATSELANSSIKVCTSCLIMISAVNDDGSIADDGFILDQTPAQMRSMSGMEDSLKYLHVFVEPKPFTINIYLLPMLFISGLIFIMGWLLYLNNEQKKLINQKNEFVNHLSHQFQTPLSSIKLSANLLANDSKVNKSELVRIIQTESNRLENHIKTVLHWVKSDSDRLQISKEKIILTDIIEKSLKQMNPVFLSNQTKVNFIPPENELTIYADGNHLQLILFNIWENAIKHNELPVELTITCKKINSGIQITTMDNGVGINKLNLDYKFKGLGLVYVKRIMEEHGGTIQLLHTRKSGLMVHLNFLHHD